MPFLYNGVYLDYPVLSIYDVKYAPLYKKGIKKPRNKSMETTVACSFLVIFILAFMHF